jgi:hypothetical protein
VLGKVLGRTIAVGKIIHGDRALLPENRGCAHESAANSDGISNEQDAGPKTAALSRVQPQVTKVKNSALDGMSEKEKPGENPLKIWVDAEG